LIPFATAAASFATASSAPTICKLDGNFECNFYTFIMILTGPLERTVQN
jgi:hypothetical protein